MTLKQVSIKTSGEIEVMSEGGAILGKIREELENAVKPGIKAGEIEKLADKLIAKSGGIASFKMVPGYRWATCININEQVVHGIPGKREINDGDIVGIDVGLYYKGFHTDTSVTVIAGKASPAVRKFIDTGKKALFKAINSVRVGGFVADISAAMQETVEREGYSPVKALTGHGIGRQLHEEPAIPCFVMGRREDSVLIREGMVLAIEVMYNMGSGEVVYKGTDGWTIITCDGKMSGLFEETVAATAAGPVVLTQPQKR